jgi:hypothetical protein
MYCPKCGAEQANDSQYCRSCGTSQSVSSTSGGAAAAVAPARVSTPTATSEAGGRTQNQWAIWALGLLAFLVVCVIIQQTNQRSNSSHVAPQPPTPIQHNLTMPKGAFTIRQLSDSNYKFIVPAGAYDVTMKGHFSATGGARNDVEVYVLNEDEFVNWQNRHQVTTLYSSGRVTQDSINLTLPADAGTYYLVFSNRFSLFSPKAVEANIDVNFYTR